MNINWKLRLQNKATLVALISALIAFIYQMCGLLGVVPPVSQETVTQILGILVNVSVTLGILVDPTTEGLDDSIQAMNYEEPKKY